MSVRSIVMAAAGSGYSPVAQYIGNAWKAFADGSTFASQSIGGPGLIIVAVASEGGGGGSVVNTGVTLDGVAMTVIRQSVSNDSQNGGEVSIWRLRVTSGSTATIVATFNRSYLRCAISVWRVTGNSSDTPVASLAITNAVGDGTFSLQLTGSAAGNAIVTAGAIGYGPSNSTTLTYGSPMIQDYYESINAGASDTGIDGGHCIAPSASYTVTRTVTGNAQFVCACAAAWA